ncbi:hypothetical protein IFR05_006793 [Cadophora sp. M221]|nr:hypothetical protein IFR05_006793 [Cadophora sp. M221]
MGTYDHAGRISKQDFLYSSASLLAICIIAAAARFWIRLRIQGEFSVDDGFLIFGLCCLISGLGFLYTYMDDMMFVEGMLTGGASFFREIPDNWQQIAYRYQRNVAVTCLLTWAAIVSVKLSFLFFFKRLLDRMHSMLVYWYIVLAFSLAVSAYGFSVYIVPCPYFFDARSFQCGQGAKTKLTFDYAISQMILDVTSDLMILVIPVHILWRVRIRLMKKVAIGSSLCLTIVMIAVTIVRASGIRQGSVIDSVWETYWQVMSAEVGLIMTSATAFRTLFIARTASLERQRVQNQPRSNKNSRIYKIHSEGASPNQGLCLSNSNDNAWDVERGYEVNNLPPSHG